MATESTYIDCGDVLDIAGVAAFHMQCLEALESNQSIVIKADEISRADTAALQVLVAFFQDANVQERSVEWQAPSDVLRQSAALLGLTDILQLQKSGD